jgi:hypothetical protein
MISDIVCNFERPWFVILCYDCEHVVCSVNDLFSSIVSCKINCEGQRGG